jgi:signal transduction histidine kinase
VGEVGEPAARGVLARLDRGLIIDVALGLFVTVSVSLTIMADLASGSPGTRDADPISYLFAVALGGLMLLRRRWPVGTMLATLVLLALYHAMDYPPVGVAVPTAAAFYSVAERGRLRWAIGGAAGFLALTTAVRVAEGDERLDFLFAYELITAVTLAAAVIAFGDAVRSRRGWQDEIRRRAAAADLEREQEAARRVEQERLRIARELHDVLAHTLSVISIQSDVAAEALADDPSASRGALRAIRSVSGDALTELRSTLRVLRASQAPQPRAPLGGLRQLDRIVGAAAEGGLEVSVVVEGEPVQLPAVVEAAAHRIVQEAITNVLRHAHATAATVELCYGPWSLTVRVSDDGHGDVEAGPGFGIQGMRERAVLLGGELHAGTRPAGGFLVEATLPIGGSA